MKLSDETIKKIEEAFAIDASVLEACYYADISSQTYYNWVNENPELKEKFDRLRERPVLKARQTIVKGLDDPNLAFKYLERKKKMEFGNSLDVTSGGQVIPIYGGISKHDSNTPNLPTQEETPRGERRYGSQQDD